jgi:hypothetical protein
MTFTRRHFLAAPVALAAAPAFTHAAPGSTLFVTSRELARMTDFARKERADFIRKRVQSALSAGPWSVTAKRPEGLGVDAGPHDYVSEGPYWFPDPANPGGPYIRHDGVRNPNRFLGNANDMRAMTDAVVALSMGAVLLGLPGCADRAASVLSAYFLDPKTRMNPDLRYGQMVRGRNTGRGTGIIDTACLIQLVHAVGLLEAGVPDFSREVSAGLRDWFRAYATWMNTSKYGLDEKKSGNNHATWWTAQIAAYATFTSDRNVRLMAWDHYRDYLVPTEILPNGSCPREEARTKSLGYSAMNLDAFSMVCRLAQLDGVDLWHFEAKNGGSVAKAFDYLLPFMLQPGAWKKEQIEVFDAATHYFTGLAGLAMPSEKLMGAYLGQKRSEGTWAQFLDILIRSGRA